MTADAGAGGLGGAAGRRATAQDPPPPTRAAAVTGAVALAVLVVGLLAWAKWAPYSAKVPLVASTHALGDSIVTGAAGTPPAVSLQAGLDFALVYFRAVWPALLAGLLIATGVQVLLPPGWLARVLGGVPDAAAGHPPELRRERRTGARGALRGGVRGAALSVPTLMCSCCAAPVAVGLRRARVSAGAALAHWVGNPVLNPVVVVFALFVLPWPWVVLRVVGGVLVMAGVLAVVVLAARRDPAVAEPREVPTDDVPAVRAAAGPPAPDDRRTGVRGLASRYARVLGGTSLRLLPEYAVVVVALGALRGVLFPVGPGAAVGVLAVVLLVVAGMLLPVPTGGEVAVVAALVAAGAAGAAGGALLLTLPALSLPSLLMVRRVLPAPMLLGTAGVVAATGVLLAVAATLLGL